MRKSTLTIALALTLASCTGNPSFWRIENGKFQRGDEPSYFLGTNMWYGPLLMSDTEAADPDRACAELDSLAALGVTNLRVLVGADGQPGVKSKVEPVLQTSPGVYDEKVFVGLDRFLNELGKRGMSAVLYMNNAWEWSGGFGQYLEWAGAGKALSTNDATWDEYRAFTSRFMTDSVAKSLAADNVRHIVSRVNTMTGKSYKDDPAIFSWQICNEPRCFSESDTVKAAFYDWLCGTAALIKSIDPNHMVSSGNEGSFGCEADMPLYEKIHACPDIDYLTIHIWPFNWTWARKDSLAEDLPDAIQKTNEYIDAHLTVAQRLGKPVVLEEFGFPRDGFVFAKGTPVTLRDRYYANIFSRLEASAKEGGLLEGVNFWTWGGLAGQSAENVYWQKGDDYCGDPAQEQQGLNSVYLSDTSTVALIRETCAALRNSR